MMTALDCYEEPRSLSTKKNGTHIPATTITTSFNHRKHNEQRNIRLWRILISFILFAFTSLYTLNQESFIIYSFHLGDKTKKNATKNGATTILTAPLAEREWDRMLFGIFTYDSPNEAEIRNANRETHLNYFRYQYEEEKTRPDVICSLNELLTNATLARDPESCRVVYTFVMGGGASSDLSLRMKVNKLPGGRMAVTEVKTRCLWEDPECGGTDVDRWTLDSPACNVSKALKEELESQKSDITLLSIPENHELGKTDTWFTYVAMLTRARSDLQIGFVGKLDSDNFVRWPVFFKYLQTHKENMQTKPYIYGGYAIHRKTCSGKVYARACLSPRVIFEFFASGAMSYLSTPLAQHVFMDGTTLERKKEVWIVGEDMQLGNMAYSDPRFIPFIINHRYGGLGQYINTHCSNNVTMYRREYYGIYRDQLKKMEAAVANAG